MSGGPPGVVLNDVIRRGVGGTLPHGLRYHEEVIPLGQGDHVVKDGSGGRIDNLTISRVELVKARVNPLRDDEERKLDVHDQGIEEFADDINLLRTDLFDLAFTDTITVEDNSYRGRAIIFDVAAKVKKKAHL